MAMSFDDHLYTPETQRRILGELCWYLLRASELRELLDGETIEQHAFGAGDTIDFASNLSSGVFEQLHKLAIEPKPST